MYPWSCMSERCGRRKGTAPGGGTPQSSEVPLRLVSFMQQGPEVIIWRWTSQDYSIHSSEVMIPLKKKAALTGISNILVLLRARDVVRNTCGAEWCRFSTAPSWHFCSGFRTSKYQQSFLHTTVGVVFLNFEENLWPWHLIEITRSFCMTWTASAHNSQIYRRGRGAVNSFYSFKVSHPKADKAQLYLAYEMWQHDSPWLWITDISVVLCSLEPQEKK